MTDAERKAAELYWRTRIASEIRTGASAIEPAIRADERRRVFAEAQRLVEAERSPLGSRRAALSHNHGIDRALDVLAALAEQA